MLLRPKGLRLCSCVCSQWKDLIYESKKLNQRRNSLDSQEPIKQKSIFGSHKSENGKYFQAHGICSFDNKVILTDYYDNTIHVLGENGQYITEFCLPDITEIRQYTCLRGVCIVNGNIWVTYYGGIQIFSPDYKPFRLITLGDYSFWGICSTPEGLVLVTTEQKEILILTQEGHIKQKIKVDICKYSWTIAYNSKGEILILDYNRIHVFNQNGLLLNTFGPIRSDPIHPYYWEMICVDWQDNIFVTNWKDGYISILDCKGNPIQKISIDIPYGLCLMKNKIVAVSGHHLIYVFSN